MVPDKGVGGDEGRLPGVPGGVRQHQPTAGARLQPGSELVTAVVVPGVGMDGGGTAVRVARQLGDHPPHGVGRAAEE
ncbi:hypothetical protein I3J09_19145 [Streptomyces clavuligerus]|uniref:hypothetical protein n=1 Tax=Streptomyces clavuligerus TaxID=1901 RepID=UPI00017FFB31|nr:hypothetical protein [Streptomyces clavuligerus]EDY50209.1 hypothetical protein SSCG_02972 [Streptomyces clavuligerus]MBY6304786.1 hypothetical protein [Streptomyces clavuligerus]QPJ93127.1 hypothetical protein GE265_09020 [Streptomyces clavuligerus]QPL64765.1 hypothetical protein I3J04_19130 [Streptomyces clavuligerus]QPL70796.1 hypothetical protein I3J05_19140 [Streptomyces clavuligerus]